MTLLLALAALCLSTGDPDPPLPLTLADAYPEREERDPAPAEPAALVFRAEQWETEFALGLRAVQWFFINTSKTIESGGTRWKVQIDDALGVGMSLSARVHDFWIENWFDYSWAVLSSVDSATFRAFGLNAGYIVWKNEWERASFFGGGFLVYPHIALNEDGMGIPGTFERSYGGVFGFRYTKVFAGRRTGTPDIGLSGEVAFRYAELVFHGDPGIGNSRFGGPGLVLSIGLFLRF